MVISSPALEVVPEVDHTLAEKIGVRGCGQQDGSIQDWKYRYFRKR